MAVLLLSSQCTSLSKKDKSEFSYQKVQQEVYQEGMGGVIPLTMENGEAYGGWITNDNQYLVFAGNRSGNFDLYVRALNDVDVFPITTLSSNQIEPALSPDGKKIAYIDDELDPDGDLVVQYFNPKSIYENQKRGRKLTFQRFKDFFVKSRRILTNDEKNRVRSIESNPTWSPDSNSIVFSSDMTSIQGSPFGPGVGAVQNLWQIDIKKPKEAQKLTKDGGVMPSFSPDGKKIIYISYQNPNQNGDVFELELETKKIRQLTNSFHFDLSPTYTPDGKNIIFTRIRDDSNGDGVIDRKDNGILFLKNLETGQLRQLSYDHLNLFDSHVSNFMGGSILLSFAKERSINVGYIPLGGIIPKRPTIDKQLAFSENFSLAKKDNRAFLMALDSIDIFYRDSSQYPVFSVLKNLEKLKSLEKNKEIQAMQNLRLEILQKIKQGETLYQIYFNIEQLQTQKKSWHNLPYLVEPGGSVANYLRKIVAKPEQYLAHYSSAIDETIKQNRRSTVALKNNSYSMVLPHLMDVYSLELKANNKERAAQINTNRLLQSYPDYYRIGEILFSKGMQDSSNKNIAIPKEFLWLLYPQHYPDKQFLQYIKNPKLVHQIKEQLYQNFQPLAAYNETAGLSDLRKQFSKSQFPDMGYLSYLASAAQALKEQNSVQAFERLKLSLNGLPQNSYWEFLYKIHKGLSYELEKNEGQAIESYGEALQIYKPDYNYNQIDFIIEKVDSFYNNNAKSFLARSDFWGSWQQYKKLVTIHKDLHNHNVQRERLSKLAVSGYMNIDELAFLNYEKDPKLMQEIEKFYAQNISEARQNLNHPFIFGRGYLYTQLGIYLHRKFDKQTTGILPTQKKRVLEYFKVAQRDFEWSFMANPNFVDSYIMLGWMYQYIDEKREQVVQLDSGRKDKEVFSRLYANYFPRYLFEENIRIYQQSIRNLQDSISPQLLVNFHLNMANNYFLLNNYGKAEEGYRFVNKNLDQGYRFENKTQKALFFFNMGKTLFFTEDYSQSLAQLQKAYQLYQEIAPLDTNDQNTNQENQKKHELILKYMALTSQYNLQYDSALKIYQNILAAKNKVNSTEGHAIVYLEMARLHKELGDVYTESSYYQKSLQGLEAAEKALANEKKIKPPRMPVRLRFMGINIPIIAKLNYDSFFIGENRLVFEIPTLQRYQYLESTRADAYQGLGMLKQEEVALQKLKDYCQKDNSRHGKQCLMSAYMRLGFSQYTMRRLESARNTYEKTIELALSQKDLAAELKARKNLLAIAAYEIENKEQSPQEKIKTIEKEKANLQNFTNNYIQSKVKEQEKQLKKKNKKFVLSEPERIAIEEKSIQQLYSLLLYQGIFDGYLSQIHQPISTQDYQEYVQEKNKNVQTFFNAIQTLNGNVSYNENNYNYSDYAKERKKNLTLSLNRAQVYKNNYLFKNAQSEYLSAINAAEEFKADVSFAVAWHGLLQTDYRFDDGVLNEETLSQSFSMLSNSTVLLDKYPHVYKNLLSGYTRKALQEQNYLQALLLENRKRHFSAWNSIQSQFPVLENVLGRNISRYQQLELIERSLQERIEQLRFARQKTQAMEQRLRQVSEQRKTLYQEIVGNQENQDQKNIARIIFSNTFNKEDVFKISEPFVFISREQNNYSFWYVANNELEYQNFSIDKQNIFSQISSLRNNPHYHQGQLPEWVVWLKQKNPSLIFPDGQLWQIPYSQLLEKPVLTSGTLEASLMYQKNFALSREQWLQAGHSSAVIQSLKAKDNLQIVKDKSDWQKYAIWSDALDYQAKLSFASQLQDENPVALADVLTSNYKPSVAVVSIEKDQTVQDEVVQDYRAAVDLLLAAQGASFTIFSKEPRSKASASLTKLFANYHPQLDNSLQVNGNPILAKAWLDKDMAYKKRKEIFANIARQEFDHYYKIGLSQFNKKKFSTALEALEHANFSLARAKKLENLFHQNTEPDPPAIHLLNLEQFNFKNEVLFSLQKKELAQEEYQIKQKQLTILKTENHVIDKKEIAKDIISEASPLEKKNLQQEQKNALPAYTQEQKNLIFAYGDRLLRHNYIEEGLATIKPISLELSNNQKYTLAESFFLTQAIQGSNSPQRSLQSYDRQLDEKINTIGLPKNPEQRMDFFLERTTRSLEWLDFLYSGLFLKRYQNLASQVSTKDLQPQLSSIAWIDTWLPRQTSLPTLEATSFDQKILAALAETSARKNFSLAVENLSQGKTELAIIGFSNILKQTQASNELVVFDAVLFHLLEKIEKHDLQRSDLQKLMQFLARTANQANQKKVTNNQRKIFYAMLSALPRIIQEPLFLQNTLLPYKDFSFSTLNRSLYNRLLAFSAQFTPQQTATMSYQSIDLYTGDQRRMDLLSHLQLFHLYAQNSDEAFLMDLTLEKEPDFPIYLTYLLNNKNYNLALKAYLKQNGHDLSSWQKWQNETPLMGVFSTYPHEFYFWTWQKQQASFQTTNGSNLQNLKGKNPAYVLLHEKNTKEQLMQLSEQTIFISHFSLPQPIAQEKKDQKKISLRQDILWQNNSQDIDLASLFFSNLGESQNIQTKTSLVLNDNISRISSAPLEIVGKINSTKSLTTGQLSNHWKIIFSGERKDYNLYLTFIDLFLKDLKKTNKIANAFLTSQKTLLQLFPQVRNKNNIWIYK